MEKAGRQRRDQVIKIKLTVVPGTDIVCSPIPGTEKAQHHFYVIPAKKACPESEHLDRSRRRNLPWNERPVSFKTIGDISKQERLRGLLQNEGD